MLLISHQQTVVLNSHRYKPCITDTPKHPIYMLYNNKENLFRICLRGKVNFSKNWDTFMVLQSEG